MRSWSAFAGGCLMCLALTSAAVAADLPEPKTTLVHCGALLDIPGREPRAASTLIIVDGRIEAVHDGWREADQLGLDRQTEQIDLRALFVLPGLIDAHTHITSEYGPDVRLERVSDSDADAAIRGVVFAERTLRAGFTTIRNVGSSGDAAFALRDAIRDRLVLGPDILVAGESISPTGGHSDGTLGYREDLFEMPAARQGIADGPAACRQAVRAQVKRGADLIKLTATGGVLSNTAAGVEQQFFDDELRAIVETAHLLGRKVAAHAHGVQGIKAALRAGVDSIEHGTYLDDECITLFRETGAFLVPTIHAGKFVAEKAAEEEDYFPDAVREKAARVGPQSQTAFGRAYRGGVRIAFGTDVGVGPHGTNAREFLHMAEAGMDPTDALVSATVNAAELLGLSDRLGTLEPGKQADLIAVQGSPIEDLARLLDVRFVMKGGRSLPPNSDSPEPARPE